MMWAWIRGLITGQTVTEAVGLVDKMVIDQDAKTKLIADIILADINKTTSPVFDGLHKLGRQLIWLTVIAWFIYAKLQGIPMTPDEWAVLLAGPGIYTLIKGKGR